MCPRKPRKPCKYVGCPNLTEEKYCKEHEKLYSSERGNASSRGYNSQWRICRKKFLKANPLCVKCKSKGKLIEATVVDHIKPHRGDKVLFWNESNWQALCKKCHDKKTMTEDRYKEYTF